MKLSLPLEKKGISETCIQSDMAQLMHIQTQTACPNQPKPMPALSKKSPHTDGGDDDHDVT